MKRIGLLLLAVVMVAGFAGCNSGGEDGYNFNGSWVITKNLTSSRCTWSYNSSQQDFNPTKRLELRNFLFRHRSSRNLQPINWFDF